MEPRTGSPPSSSRGVGGAAPTWYAAGDAAAAGEPLALAAAERDAGGPEPTTASVAVPALVPAAPAVGAVVRGPGARKMVGYMSIVGNVTFPAVSTFDGSRRGWAVAGTPYNDDVDDDDDDDGAGAALVRGG